MRFSIDLHAHTTASDGTVAPADLVHLAIEQGLSALAITDHDTLAGLEEAIKEAEGSSLEVVPGIELSVDREPGSCHLLGYLFDRDNSELKATLERLRVSREGRNVKMIARLKELGVNLTLEEAAAEAKGDLVARPHFARAMIRKGYVSSIREAFDKYLAEDAPGYVFKERLTVKQAVDLIHQAGGVVSLAHPLLIRLGEAELESELLRMKSAGLDAIEAYYNRHSPEQSEQMQALATRLGLLSTGGSDFHGHHKPEVRLGEVFNAKPAPDRLLTALKERAEQYR